MRPRSYFEIFSSFVSLRPRPEQVWNVAKYACRHFLTGFSPVVTHAPLSVGVLVTYRCNLNCPDCFVNNAVNRTEYREADMTATEFERYITHPLARKAFRVSFSGGEPLLNPALPEFVRIARRERKYTYLITNGLLLEKNIEALVNAQLDILRVSLYESSLEKQIAGIHAAQKQRVPFKIYLSSFVGAKNYSFCEEMIKLAIDLKIDRLNVQAYDLPLSVTPEDPAAENIIWDDNKEAMAFFDGLRRQYGSRLKFSLPNPVSRKPVVRQLCNQLVTIFFFDRHGLLSPCGCIFPCEKRYGSLEDSTGWNSEYMVRFRRDFVGKFPFHKTCQTCWWAARMADDDSDFIY